jgi:hypothetical protein
MLGLARAQLMHECRDCGLECDCDGEDHGGNPQPANCYHLVCRCPADDDEEDDCELDDNGKPIDWEDD